MSLPDEISGALTACIMGFWAFLGAVTRGATDWKDPVTKKFSAPRFGAAVATALALGQVANAIGQHWHWEPTATSALASFVGYLGPAATMQLFKTKFFGGGKDDDGKS